MTRIGSGRKLLLIGWDGADWGLLTPLLDRGMMPALDALIDRGTMARLSGLAPSLSPLLWTSIATGKRADKHGILSATEADMATGLRLPVSARGRKTSTLWEILDARGLRAHAIGWPASGPAGLSKTAGVVVSDRFARAPNPIGEPWPVEPGSVAPARLAMALGEFRVHPGDLDAAAIQTFLPLLSEIDIARDHRPAAIADVVAEAATVHAAATWVLEHEPWDFLAVHYAAPERLCDDFLRYTAPPLPGVAARDAELYGGVVNAGYRLLDMMLGRLVELAGDEATVVLVSDHGYAASPVRPDGSTAVRAHGGRGVFVAAGPEIRRDELIHGAGPLDVAPTVLALFGLPVGADMDGRPLRAVWQNPPRIESIPTWDDRIARPEPDVAGPLDPDGALAELRSQGYDDGPPPWLPRLVKEARSNQAFHLAMVYLDARRPVRAIPILKGLHAEAPANSVVTLYLSYCLTLVGAHSGARTLLETIGEGHEDRPLRWLVEAMILIGEGKPDQAAQRLDQAGSTHRELPEIHTLIGHAYGQAGRPDDASRAYERALEIDDDWAEAHEGLARCHLRRHRWEEAADSALSAVGLDHYRPDAHYVLGVALERIGRRDDAERAFVNALDLRPGWPAALDALATLRNHHRRPGPLALRH